MKITSDKCVHIISTGNKTKRCVRYGKFYNFHWCMPKSQLWFWLQSADGCVEPAYTILLWVAIIACVCRWRRRRYAGPLTVTLLRKTPPHTHQSSESIGNGSYNVQLEFTRHWTENNGIDSTYDCELWKSCMLYWKVYLKLCFFLTKSIFMPSITTYRVWFCHVFVSLYWFLYNL